MKSYIATAQFQHNDFHPDFHIFQLLHLYGYNTNSQNDQLSVGLIAQLVERCTGFIAEVVGLNPVQA